MKKAIVTGANGFIGSALVKELLDNDVFVYALVHNSASNLNNNKKLKVLKFSLDDIISLLSEFDNDIDIFYHLAWQGSSGENRSNAFIQHSNIRWTIDALHFAHKLGIKRFVGAGSLMEKESVYDVPIKMNKPSMATIYGSAKLTAHYITKAIAANLGIEHLWCYLTAYGIGDSPHRFICSTINKMLNNEKYINLTKADQFYDFVYITDTAKALYLIGEKGIPFTAYNIGSGNPKPLKDFILEMKTFLDYDGSINFGTIDYKGIYLPIEEFFIKDIITDTGFVPVVSFENGIMKTSEWIKNLFK